jgi:hypothetical protein
MADPVPSPWLDVLEPLRGAFGEELRFSRVGPVARWSYEGHAAIVELLGADRIVARFVAPPVIDAISGEPSAPEYVREVSGYSLSRAGCERLVADMVAFFSGAREPDFTFVSAG